MNYQALHKVLTYLIAAVWLINGLFCKVLNFVPRHQQIVSVILGNTYAEVLTQAIGIAEILMAVWIITRIKPYLSAFAQIIVVMVMNVLEFWLAPELLFWGRFNILFATLFVLIVYINEFVLIKHFQ
ncbi:MAG: DoxX-like family protein [Bacteroidota bacterium]